LIPETSKGGIQGVGIASDCEGSCGNCERKLHGKYWCYYSSPLAIFW